jgi:PAS domain S-box-containing protein
MTGYTAHEILGRNCRFLQAPGGQVRSGDERKYTDPAAVKYLKDACSQMKEAQINFINYRKGGQPFMNLLTIIPIREDDGSIKRIIGLQIDLVEQPGAVIAKNPDGSLTVEYQNKYLPRFHLPFVTSSSATQDSNNLIGRGEVGKILSSLDAKESGVLRPLFERVVLENHDDVICVLSLKGVIQYVSAAVRQVLEYSQNELIGKPLSTICHPSDIVSATRVLKDAAKEESVNIAFRVSRKHSGYAWFEFLGSLYTETGKGKKHIIFVGRERPVYSLAKRLVMDGGGIAENEIWSKVTTSGAFLFVSSMSKVLLDRSPDELVGYSFHDLMRNESRTELDRALNEMRHAPSGKPAQFKHEMQNRRGQFLQAKTNLYPGTGPGGERCGFFIAQTTMLKHWRSSTNVGILPQAVMAAAVAKANQATAATPPLGPPAPPRKRASSIDPNAQGSGRSTLLQAMGISSSPQFWEDLANNPPAPGSNSDSATVVFKSSSVERSLDPNGSIDGGRMQALKVPLQSNAMDPPPIPDNEDLFEELKSTRSSAWQFELHQMIVQNKLAAEELATLLAARKKRKRRKIAGQSEKECTRCGTKSTPEWRRGPTGKRDLCNSCGLKFAKQVC